MVNKSRSPNDSILVVLLRLNVWVNSKFILPEPIEVPRGNLKSKMVGGLIKFNDLIIRFVQKHLRILTKTSRYIEIVVFVTTSVWIFVGAFDSILLTLYVHFTHNLPDLRTLPGIRSDVVYYVVYCGLGMLLAVLANLYYILRRRPLRVFIGPGGIGVLWAKYPRSGFLFGILGLVTLIFTTWSLGLLITKGWV